jgi:hypothetical protein
LLHPTINPMGLDPHPPGQDCYTPVPREIFVSVSGPIEALYSDSSGRFITKTAQGSDIHPTLVNRSRRVFGRKQL